MTNPLPPSPAAPPVHVPAPPVQVPVPVSVSVAELIAAAVLACPSVAGLHGGRFGEVATYLPGRRVSGVRVTPGQVVVHLVGRYPAPVSDIDAEVRAGARPHLGGLPLTIVVEDYAVEDYAQAVTTPAITIAVTATPAITAAQPRIAPVPSGPDTAAAEPSAAPPPARPARGITADLTKEIL